MAAMALGALTLPAAAHERWVHHDLIRPFDRTLFETLCWTNGLTALAIVASAFWLWHLSHRARVGAAPLAPFASLPPGAGGAFMASVRDWCPTLLRIAYGVTLVVFALRGQYLAPDLRAGTSVEGQLLVGIAATAGVLLILGYRTREAALLTVLIFGWAVVRRPFVAFGLSEITQRDVLTYGEVVGIGLYLAIVGGGRLALDARRAVAVSPSAGARDVALALNRVALAVTLVLLGLVKFLVPALFMGVVQNYPDVFHHPFEEFFGTTEEEVVFGASAIEVALGLYLLLGVYSRAVVAVLGAVFTTTAVLFQEEVLGHLPLVGMVLVILVEGGGSLRPLWRGVAHGGRVRLPAVKVLRGSLTFGVGAVVVGFACGATLYGAQPSLAETGPWEAALGTNKASGVYMGHRERCALTIEVVPGDVGLNELFALRTTVREAGSGELVEGVALEVDVTMPQHGHGMPTSPRTRSVRGGRFVTEGCKLHMYGAWLVQVKVMRAGQLWDRASILYDFRPAGRS